MLWRLLRGCSSVAEREMVLTAAAFRPSGLATEEDSRVLPCFSLWARGLACTPLRYMGHALESLGGPVFSRPAYRARVAGAGELYSKKAGATPPQKRPSWLPQEPSTRRKGRGEAGVGRTCRRPGWAPGVRTAAARVYRGQLVTSVSRGPMQGRGEPETSKKNGKSSS